jgi:hypothetical protein
LARSRGRSGRGKFWPRVSLTDSSLGFLSQFLNRLEKFPAVADGADPDILKIVRGQAGEEPSIDIVVAKCLRISLQTQ